MKNISLSLLLLVLAGAPAAGQVTVNPAAVDPPAKPAPKPAQPPSRPAPAKPAQAAAKPVPPQPAPARAVPDVPQKPPEGANLPPGAKPAAAAGLGDAPGVPLVPPSPPVLPPPLVVVARPAAPAGPVAITADAPGAVAPLPGGLRVMFGPGRSDMTQAMSESIRALARTTGKTETFNVTALAAGSGDDMSAPRRLSLARGLAVRALLINEGVASTRIYVRALGGNAEAIGSAPADRTDIMIGSTPPARPVP